MWERRMTEEEYVFSLGVELKNILTSAELELEQN